MQKKWMMEREIYCFFDDGGHSRIINICYLLLFSKYCKIKSMVYLSVTAVLSEVVSSPWNWKASFLKLNKIFLNTTLYLKRSSISKCPGYLSKPFHFYLFWRIDNK